MVILGLLLIVLGGIAILSALFVSEGQAELLGLHLSAFQIFLIGVVSGAFILWGFTILKYGTKRELAQRRERRKIEKLSKQLDTVEADREREARPPDRPEG